MKEEKKQPLMQRDGGWSSGGGGGATSLGWGGGGSHHHRVVVVATKTMESSYENEVLVIDWPLKFLFLLIDSGSVDNIDTSGGTSQ